MKYTCATITTALLAQCSNAHYIFSKLVVGGVESEDFQYIRGTTRAEIYMPTKFTNTFDDLTPNDDDFRCNLGSFSNAASTEVADVAAGDTLAMKLFYDGQIQHPGPGSVFMSKAPGSVVEYEGDGDWFKIWSARIADPNGDLTTDAWEAWDMPALEFTIPEDTPAGEYLVRAEHIGLHGAQAGEAEFYYSCAQIKVSGSGEGSPSVTYKIPGLYDDSMTLFNGANLWVNSAADFESYMDETPVGDAVWGGGGGSASPVSSSPNSPSSSAAPVAPSGSTSSSPFPSGPAVSSSAPVFSPSEAPTPSGQSSFSPAASSNCAVEFRA